MGRWAKKSRYRANRTDAVSFQRVYGYEKDEVSSETSDELV